MTTHAFAEAPIERLEPMVAELLAEALSQGLRVLHDRLFEFDARAIGDGQLVVDIRQIAMAAETDPRLSGVLLQVSVPATKQSQDEPKASAT